MAKPARNEIMAMVIKSFAFDEASLGDGEFQRGVVVGDQDGKGRDDCARLREGCVICNHFGISKVKYAYLSGFDRRGNLWCVRIHFKK